MSGTARAIIIILLAAVLAWLFGVTPGRARAGDAGAVDRDELEAAEEEVSEPDAFATPEDAEEELRDWGPGAPK